ncbi:MAG: glycoside hydrolase family 16 protein [Alistipes sp.]|jgi:hypothetical protein|nr:glycoside hydrolase family 16 protein [Alistipes sp.]
MNRFFATAIATSATFAALAVAAPVSAQNVPEPRDSFHKEFIEQFDRPTSKYFHTSARRTGDDFRYFPGVSSLSEKETDVMIFRIDPNDPVGAGRGPEIVSKEKTHFGTYSARLRVPDVTKVQPNVGAVVGYFTYLTHDNADGLSEIDFEWLIADPEVIYIGTWTGNRPLNRIGRIINLAKGIVYNTSYRKGDGENTPFTDEAGNTPRTIAPIEGYDASARFYTYGFDWLPDRLTWWIEHPQTGEKIVLWDYTGSTPEFSGIPKNPTLYRLNFWHTNNWAVQTNPNSLEKPLYPYEVEVDWMKYTPLGK